MQVKAGVLHQISVWGKLFPGTLTIKWLVVPNRLVFAGDLKMPHTPTPTIYTICAKSKKGLLAETSC